MNTLEALDILELSQREGYANAKAMAGAAIEHLRKEVMWKPIESAPLLKEIILFGRGGNLSVGVVSERLNGSETEKYVIPICNGDYVYYANGDVVKLELQDIIGWKEVE